MKKNRRSPDILPDINKQDSLKAIGQVYKEPSNLVFLLHWLAGTILFFLFYNLAIPFLLGSIDDYNPVTGITSNNLFFVICGLFIYFIEPLVHYSFTYQQQKENDENLAKLNVNVVPGSIADFIAVFFRFIGIFFWVMPYMILVWGKPVFRALILLESFSLLNFGDGESRLFVIILTTDIFLYYINLVFPNWKHSPNKLIARSAWFGRSIVYRIGRFSSIIFTAIICSAFATGAYQQTGYIRDKSEEFIILLWFWYLLTLYVRMDYIGSNIDNLYETVKAMPRRNLLLNILILVISFIGFMWRYFSGSY